MSDLKKMATDELKSLQKKITMELQRREKDARNAAKRKIFEIANSHNIDLNTLRIKDKQYRSPDDQWKVWNGKGRKPKWIVEWMAKHGSLEDLEV